METAILYPIFKQYNLIDVLPNVQRYVDHKNSKYSSNFSILGYRVYFENPDERQLKWSNKCKHIVLDKIEKKYQDFNKIIDNCCRDMRSRFVESHVCKLYQKVNIEYIIIKFLRVRGRNNYQFNVVVNETGKGGKSYWMSAGKINVDIN